MSKNKSQFLTEYAIKPLFTTIYGVFFTLFFNTFCEIFKNRANYYKIVTKFSMFLTIPTLILSLFYVFFWLIIPSFYYTIIYSVILYKINKKMTEKNLRQRSFVIITQKLFAQESYRAPCPHLCLKGYSSSRYEEAPLLFLL